jgi:hypothetical protein
MRSRKMLATVILVREGKDLDTIVLPQKDPVATVKEWLRRKGFQFQDGDGKIVRDAPPCDENETSLSLEIQKGQQRERLTKLVFK